MEPIGYFSAKEDFSSFASRSLSRDLKLLEFPYSAGMIKLAEALAVIHGKFYFKRAVNSIGYFH
jgi:hypothetical protein